MSPHTPRIELITTGQELLLGLHANAHLMYLGDQCVQHGMSLSQETVVDDSIEAIALAFKQAWDRSQIVITTGGLGPTSDDNTREGVAQALNLPLEFDSTIQAQIEARLSTMGMNIADVGLKLCQRPQGFEPISNAHGTAAGLFYQDTASGKIAIILPGPSAELAPMFERHIVPRLQQAGVCSTSPCFVQLRTAGVPESYVAKLLGEVFDNYPGLGVAYCAHPESVDVRISIGKSKLLWSNILEIAEHCESLLGEDFVTFGQSSLSEIVIKSLEQMGRTVAVAESCTGGGLAEALTDIPGSSKSFLGGIIAYHNDTKIEQLDVPESLIIQHGAISAETAVAMAAGVAERFGSDYGLSTTGFAGPDGGTPEAPVGTVFLGFYSPYGIWSRKLVFPSSSRSQVRARAVQSALDWIRREIHTELSESTPAVAAQSV
ncbi:MAG: hypothetical protein B7X06_01985 [Verrucomicrobia bacterium 21-51-4]|nr:MAG: hypothetical protein B7X06_01985 [Verrucomicrobia bacterium 21-51-4]HQU08421.1 CinA family nicotinamide mononucleotide deamidase-related protein [Opitutales bacterium]